MFQVLCTLSSRRPIGHVMICMYSHTEKSQDGTFLTLATFFPNACACEEEDRGWQDKKATSAGPTHASAASFTAA
jgi:hypothetical protein